ncbi:Sec-independent protein translocase, TatC subunit [Xylanimonas cellulosilytica DSM 15894]|uniref:Sec-independent protein translocase protein TatC n=1 Tax=Xylanimonas cellulosilytica (strain DSM 15894 / JCM 12276 / CECT 5975 / KCTC 9989 / LMG 20990 / NBRC 107835 / XIL07) TaxID=446471 RepID=TATC_XYLCX|nr:twin-arginine translocase subunit TatC [Xylanimonas cellulosilytica]D1BTU8.1 RecName: Full=Sec-independent protein translocase protein TatC [Xylanimonas cellulosilytica DSM 15894]ACZ29112.1 Sec-independent protein translocase, TatC subunit [Xylanimonas cellulosilytica DSM 15894]
MVSLTSVPPYADATPDTRASSGPAPGRRKRMPLREHLAELRTRLLLVAGGLVVGAVVGWLLYDPLLVLLTRPLHLAAATQHKDIALNFTALGSPLDTRIKVSLFLAVMVTCPWWLYQVWAFVTPGLTRREKRHAYGFLGAAVPLFLGGAGLSWWVLPHAVDIFASFVPAGSSQYVNAQEYLSFVMRLVLAFGVAFVAPVLLVALNLAGIVRHETLARGWRWAVLLAFVFAAVMTPTPDALTMVLVAAPICALYFGALGVAVWHDRRADRRTAPAAA